MASRDASPTPGHVVGYASAIDEEEWLAKMSKSSDAGKGINVDYIIAKDKEGTLVRPLRPTSPTSVEAFLRLGVDPAELVYLPPATFAERGLSPELQELKYQHHEKMRKDRLNALKDERSKIIAEAQSAPLNKSKPKGPQAVVRGFEGGDMVEKEKKRLEVLQRRQAREMEMRAAYEGQRMAMQAAAQRKLSLETERHAAAGRDKLLREKEWNAQLRQKEKERAGQQAAAEEASRQAEIKRLKDEQEWHRREQEKEKQRSKDAEQKELERIQKAEEHRQQTLRILAEQNAELMRRASENELKELRKIEMIQRKKEELEAAHEENRLKAMARLQAALENGRQQLQAKRLEFEKKQTEVEKRRLEMEEQRKREDEHKRETIAAKNVHRQERHHEAEKIEETRVDVITTKSLDKDAKMREANEAKARDEASRKIQRLLQVQEKQLKVESMKRVQAYQRNKLLDKIMSETQRARSLIEMKRELQERRKQANVQASMQRQQMTAMYEKMQITKKERPATAA